MEAYRSYIRSHAALAQLGGAYRRSIADGRPRAHAHDIMCEPLRKLSATGSGDALMNAMLSGVDEERNDVSSDLSVLIMECCPWMIIFIPQLMCMGVPLRAARCYANGGCSKARSASSSGS